MQHYKQLYEAEKHDKVTSAIAFKKVLDQVTTKTSPRGPGGVAYLKARSPSPAHEVIESTEGLAAVTRAHYLRRKGSIGQEEEGLCVHHSADNLLSPGSLKRMHP